MSQAFPHLFSPVQVGPFTLKNRIAVSAHGPMYAVEGLLTQRYVDYEVEKAKGGAGLVIMSFGLADPDAAERDQPTWRALVATWRKENIARFREIVQGVHAHGARVFFQFGESPYRTRMAPSAFPHSGITGQASREMSPADIRQMMDAYALCAENLAQAGLDGIEMHGHGDLFSDFFSPAINRRADRYGGSRENRTRFFQEAAAVIRGVIGRDMALGARLSADDRIPGSLPLEEGVEIARLLAAGGQLDYLNVDTTIEPQLLPQMIAPMYVAPGHQLYAAEAVKAAVGPMPVFTVGRITTPELAEQVIADGRADVVTMARALIADPELPNKAREGRTADIRPCLGDNQECIARVNRALPMGCTVNPAAGRETDWGIGRIAPAARRRKLLVVGGGPAGMEAARVAASRGHQVVLYEKGEALGGAVNLARRLPGRADLGRFIPWQARQLATLGVAVQLSTEATPETVAAEAPDAVVLAAGATWQTSGFNALTFQETPGWAGRALSLSEVVAGRVEPGRRVVVYDLKGFTEAPGVAELLAADGRTVELVTPLPKLGIADLDLTGQTGFLMARLKAAGVRVTVDTLLTRIEDGAVGVVDVHSGAARSLACDDVVIVAGRTPNDALAQELAALGLEVRRIGDCFNPLNIGAAFRQGFEAGVEL